MQAETAVPRPQAQELQGHQRLEEAGRVPVEPPGEGPPCWPFDVGPESPERWENKFV